MNKESECGTQKKKPKMPSVPAIAIAITLVVVFAAFPLPLIKVILILVVIIFSVAMVLYLAHGIDEMIKRINKLKKRGEKKNEWKKRPPGLVNG